MEQHPEGTVSRAFPDGVKPLSIQVGGHKFGTEDKSADDNTGSKKTNIGILEYPDGTLLKELQSPPRGHKELTFYQEIFSPDCTDPVLLKLRELVPKYFGLYTFPELPTRKFIKLENIIGKFHKPCVADIKIGRITHDPEASENKIKSEQSKYPPARVIGFTLTGFRTYDSTTDTYQDYDKIFCRRIPGDKMATEGLGNFFNIKHDLKRDLISKVIEKLTAIEKWFELQTQLAFYASSLLIVYEGDTGKYPAFKSADVMKSDNKICDVSGTVIKQLAKTEHLTDVRMIDFAHVFPASSRDENYLHGLNSVIKHLKTLIDI